MADGIIRLGQRTTNPAGVAGTVGIFCKGDRIFSVDASGNVVELIPSDGWINPYEIWSYASATTINVPSGAASKYQVGYPIRWKQGGAYKYAYIVGVADTLLTITGGSDYSVTNSEITDNYYSITSNPIGFPIWFNLTAPTWTTTGTAFTNQPTMQYALFSITGREVFLSIHALTHATSGGTGVFIATFTSGQLPSQSGYGCGTAISRSTGLTGICYKDSSNVLKIWSYATGAIAGNSDYFIAQVNYRI